MAAPGATFRHLVSLGRSLPPRAARAYGVRASATGELVTHTGQVYDEKDYRRIRFVGRQKEVINFTFTHGLLSEPQTSHSCTVNKTFLLLSTPANTFAIKKCLEEQSFASHLEAKVNKNFAIDLIAEQPVSEVESRVISCDGGGGALGHPKVYINLDKDTKTGTCGYCGLQFKQKHH